MIILPIARDKSTNKLVNVKDVPNGKDCNCYCDNCKEDLVAVNQEIKQKAHFRHNKSSACEFNNNYESYLHWLAKEVFRTAKYINLPLIRINDLSHNQQEYFNKEIDSLIKRNNLETLFKVPYAERNVSNYQFILLQDVTQISIDSCLIEKQEQSNLASIRPDILILFKNQKLYIEPYYSHPIDALKRKIIKELDISTISIKLTDFAINNQYIFTLEKFENFLINDSESKKWEFIRNSKCESLIKNLFNKIQLNRIDEFKAKIHQNELIDAKVKENSAKIKILQKEISVLEKQKNPINFHNLFKNRNK